MVFLFISKVLIISVALDDISYVDFPELRVDKHESTKMPFRYVKRLDGSPVMPKVCRDSGREQLSFHIATFVR